MYIYIYSFITNIMIWLYTEGARAVSRGQFSRNFGTFHEYKLSLYFLSPLLGGRKFTTFLGVHLEFSQKVMVFWEVFSSPQSVYHQANAVRSVRVGRGFDSPLVRCHSVGLSVAVEQCLLKKFSWSFGRLLWDAAFDSNFEEQLWGARGATLRLCSSIDEQLL